MMIRILARDRCGCGGKSDKCNAPGRAGPRGRRARSGASRDSGTWRVWPFLGLSPSQNIS